MRSPAWRVRRRLASGELSFQPSLLSVLAACWRWQLSTKRCTPRWVVHPIVIEEHTDEGLAQLEALMAQRPPKLVAVGEIGLDLYRDDPQFDRQQALLEAQLRLAKRYDLPVILHSRRTHDKLAMLLKKHALPRTGVIHGFAGSLQQAERFVQLGYKIGVGGTITYPRASKTP